MAGINPAELQRIDRELTVSLDLLRHSSNVEAKVLALIEAMRKELIFKISEGDLTAWGKARLNTMLKEANEVIAQYYSQAQAALVPTQSLVADVAVVQTAKAMAASVPGKAVLNALVTDLLVEGAPLKAWWSKMSQDTAFKFSSAVRMGIAQGETQSQIFKRVNDTVDMAGKNSAALVHSTVMQVLNDSRMAVQEANADDESVTVWISALDNLVCLECGPRDGLEWKTLSKEPVGHDLPWMQPPIHVNCRCTTYAGGILTDAMREAGGRASEQGVVKGSTTFQDFLDRQPEAWQDSVLGPGRAELYRKEKLSLRDLVSGRGTPLTLDQIKKKYE